MLQAAGEARSATRASRPLAHSYTTAEFTLSRCSSRCSPACRTADCNQHGSSAHKRRDGVGLQGHDGRKPCAFEQNSRAMHCRDAPALCSPACRTIGCRQDSKELESLCSVTRASRPLTHLDPTAESILSTCSSKYSLPPGWPDAVMAACWRTAGQVQRQFHETIALYAGYRVSFGTSAGYSTKGGSPSLMYGQQHCMTSSSPLNITCRFVNSRWRGLPTDWQPL